MSGHKVKNEPLIRIAKNKELSKNTIFIIRILAVILSLAAGGVFIMALGYNPFEIYAAILKGAFKNKIMIQETVKVIIPLLISSLAVTLAFKMRFWNIGAEGQMIMGAVCASAFALYFSWMNHWLLMLCMFVAAVIGGGIWGLIPAIFKNKYNTNETLFTLMLNYIALYVIYILRDGIWKDPSSPFPKIAMFVQNARLDKVLGVHFGWIVAIVLVILVYIYIEYTKHGYEIKVVGESQSTATYAGMNVNKIITRTMFLSGAVAGIAGMVKAAGSDLTLSTSVAGGIGFTAIIVAWLAQLNPVAICIVTVLLSALEKGCASISSAYPLMSADCADILQGIILFFILGCELFVRYKFVFGKIRKGGRK